MIRRVSVFLVCVLLMYAWFASLAEARRMGGGRSFGSRPSYQRNAPKPQAPERDAGQRQTQPGAPAPGRAWGGLGGMLGGLVMGGLIGSLLFGGGRGVGGIGLLDILIIGGGLFLLFRFLQARRAATQSASAMPFMGQTSEPVQAHRGSLPPPPPPVDRIPAGFDESEFLSGAKAAYSRLQDAWDRRDLEDIRHFTSSEVWEEIKRQAEEDPTPSKTEIVLVDAKLLEVKNVDGDTVASALFDVLMREDPSEKRPKQIREVWHFGRKESQPGSFWRLEGIQQLEQ